MKKKYSFVSIITTDDYLPGLLVLFDSLMATRSLYSFLVLLTPTISPTTLSILDKYNIKYKILLNELKNPTDVDRKHRWFSTYSKLYVFDQIQYNKIVYLDADMLILRNIDELFNYPHMSAVSTGSMLPRKSFLTHLNSGLLVVEPSHILFKDMLKKLGKIEKLQSGGTMERPKFGSEQDFLNAYYSNWSNKRELHLDHKYNIFHYHLEEYNNLFGYSIESGSKSISIIHYASYKKPWGLDEEAKSDLKQNFSKSLELRAIKLWLDRYEKFLGKNKKVI